MQQEYIQYLKSLLKYAGFVILTLGLAHWLKPALLVTEYCVPIFLFFLVVNAGFHYLLIKLTAGKSAEAFVNSYMLFMGYKFLTYLIGAATFVFTISPAAMPFALSFFLVYLMFAVFEIRYLVKHINNQQKP